jgi:hypothetical protein
LLACTLWNLAQRHLFSRPKLAPVLPHRSRLQQRLRIARTSVESDYPLLLSFQPGRRAQDCSGPPELGQISGVNCRVCASTGQRSPYCTSPSVPLGGDLRFSRGQILVGPARRSSKDIRRPGLETGGDRECGGQNRGWRRAELEFGSMNSRDFTASKVLRIIV